MQALRKQRAFPPQGPTSKQLAGPPEIHVDFQDLTPEMQSALRVWQSLSGVEMASSRGESIWETGPGQYLDVNGSTNPLAMGVGTAGIHRLGNATLDAVYNACIPKTKEGVICYAYDWAERDDFLSSFLEIKKDLAVMGFALRCKEEEGGTADLEDPPEGGAAPKDEVPLSTGNDPQEPVSLSPGERKRVLDQVKFQRYLAQVIRKWDLNAVLSDLVDDWHIADNMILYWNVEQKAVTSESSTIPPATEPDPKETLLPGIQDIMALSPKDCRWENDFGQDVLWYRFPQSIKDKVMAYKKASSYTTKAYGEAEVGIPKETLDALINREGIPRRWIDAIWMGSDWIDLRNDEGDYWLIRTKKRRRNGLTEPSMRTVFLWLEMRKTLKEGDYATSFVMKHFILHVRMGESIPSGPLAGQKTCWVSPAEAQGMEDKLKTATKTMKLVTNHTVKFEFVFPPKEMFEDEKYKKGEASILNWGGLTMVLLTGDGATNSSGYIGTKRLAANLKKTRKEISYLFTEFFDHSTIKAAMAKAKQAIPESNIVGAIFNENGLKESKQLLDELKFLCAQALIDPRTATEELERDPDSARNNKLRAMADNQRTGVYRPMIAAAGGRPGGTSDVTPRAPGAGRPPNTGTTQDADTRHQPVVTK